MKSYFTKFKQGFSKLKPCLNPLKPYFKKLKQGFNKTKEAIRYQTTPFIML